MNKGIAMDSSNLPAGFLMENHPLLKHLNGMDVSPLALQVLMKQYDSGLSPWALLAKQMQGSATPTPGAAAAQNSPVMGLLGGAGGSNLGGGLPLGLLGSLFGK